MHDTRVWIFFYGTFMNAAVLTSHGLQPAAVIAARISGYELQIKGRANLARVDRGVVYGSIARLTHEEIDTLYQGLKEQYGIIYLPHPVLAETQDGALRPALCYIASDLEDGVPDVEYIGQMIEAAKAVEAPEWYVELIKSFAAENRR